MQVIHIIQTLYIKHAKFKMNEIHVGVLISNKCMARLSSKGLKTIFNIVEDTDKNSNHQYKLNYITEKDYGKPDVKDWYQIPNNNNNEDQPLKIVIPFEWGSDLPENKIKLDKFNQFLKFHKISNGQVINHLDKQSRFNDRAYTFERLCKITVPTPDYEVSINSNSVPTRISLPYIRKPIDGTLYFI